MGPVAVAGPQQPLEMRLGTAEDKAPPWALSCWVSHCTGARLPPLLSPTLGHWGVSQPWGRGAALVAMPGPGG